MPQQFRWTAEKELALQLDWHGQRAHQIAAIVGDTVHTVEGWRRRPAWRKRRRELSDAAWQREREERDRESQARQERRQRALGISTR